MELGRSVEPSSGAETAIPRVFKDASKCVSHASQMRVKAKIAPNEANVAKLSTIPIRSVKEHAKSCRLSHISPQTEHIRRRYRYLYIMEKFVASTVSPMSRTVSPMSRTGSPMSRVWRLCARLVQIRLGVIAIRHLGIERVMLCSRSCLRLRNQSTITQKVFPSRLLQ